MSVWTDSLVTSRMYEQGPQGPWQASPNVELWRVLWGHVAKRQAPTEVFWTKAHAYEKPWLIDQFAVPLHAVIGNACADLMAGRGAQRAELPLSVTAGAVYLYALVRKVQLRLVYILLYMLEHYPRAVTSRACRRPVPVLSKLGMHMFASKHVLYQRGDRLWCVACGRSPMGQDAFRSWVSGPCLGLAHKQLADQVLANALDRPQSVPAGTCVVVGGVQLHHSHRLIVYRGFYACVLCGRAAGVRTRLLAHECVRELLPSGALLLQRLNKGLLPWGVKKWPGGPKEGPALAL